MRFKQFMMTENYMQNIVGMFSPQGQTPVAGAGATQFGAQAAGAQGDPTDPQGNMAANQPMPELQTITGADPASKAKAAMKALEDGYKQMGQNPAFSPKQIDQASNIAAMNAAIQGGKANSNDVEGLRVFAQNVNEKDVEGALQGMRMQNIQAPQIAANTAAAQTGAAMAGQGVPMA